MASKPDQPRTSSRTKGAPAPQVPPTEQNSIQPKSIAEQIRKARSEAAAQDENTIRARRTRIRSAATEDAKSKAASGERPESDPRAVPEHINTRYIKVGNKYHFTNGDPAFADRGRGLITRLENTEVIRDLIAIAKERGWDDIAIRGTERFRKEAWQQANLAELTVRGYRPSEIERAQLARLIGRGRDDGQGAPSTPTTAPAERSASRSSVAEESPRTDSRPSPQAPDRVRAGRLLDHGTQTINLIGTRTYLTS